MIFREKVGKGKRGHLTITPIDRVKRLSASFLLEIGMMSPEFKKDN